MSNQCDQFKPDGSERCQFALHEGSHSWERKPVPERPPSANMEQETGEMHWRDGWTFKRLEDGTVRIRQNTHPMMLGNVLSGEPTAVIPPNEWVSIIHHVGVGPTAEAFEIARTLHGPPSSPVADNWLLMATLPEGNDHIIAAWRDGAQDEAGEVLLVCGQWLCLMTDCYVTPTHWMPLPSAPSPSAGAAKEPKP